MYLSPTTSLTVSSVRAAYMPPADLAQKRVSRGSCFTDKRARARNDRPNKSFFDSLKYTSSSRPRWRTKLLLFRKTAIKNTPQLLARYLFGAPSGTRTQDPLIKSQLLSQMTQTKPILKSVQTSFIALSSLFHVKLDLLLFEFAFFKQPDTTPKSNTIH